SPTQGANSVFNRTNLSECITGIVTVKVWGGVTMVSKMCGKKDGDEVPGLEQVENGLEYALTRPGLMTFPLWWHAMHSGATVLAHYGRNNAYNRLREVYNKKWVAF
ncbi:unnamed protein product, partial [Choristocarpus tenellus]